MANVILIDPDSGCPNTRPQLGTLHLAAMLLQQGVTVEILDLSVLPDGLARLQALLNDNTIFVGISVVIGPMLRSGIAAAEIVRRFNPDLPVVWGGVHPSTEPDTTLAHDAVDIVCLGEGEETVLELYDAIANGTSLHNVHSIGFMENGKPVFTRKRHEYFDLDSLPALPYHLIDLSLYKRGKGPEDFFGLKGEQILSIESTRGCAFRCTYCVNAAKREKFRKMSAEKVISCVEDIVNQGVNSITFNDDNLFVDKRRAETILNEIIRRGWKLEMFIAVRSDFLAAQDDAFYELLIKAGVTMFGIGVESGSNRVLDHIRKKEGIDVTFEASKKLAKHGIKAWYHFIFGFPGERREDLEATYRAMYRISATNPYAQVNLNQLIPNPGTPSCQECFDMGWPVPKTMENWADVMVHTRRMGRPAYVDEELLDWFKEHLDGLVFPRREMPYIESAWNGHDLSWREV
ncbi:B12-binding domain-containing radical SAM protein [Desulfobacter vibrioformis]|uniref:B12-binding domain-containing radical SAM protein n=1 Tax=Desulfobacter vibrioformis TaxID=34031 RepID=UPI0005552967|nr:radical SAM protein [Desulfobacter vibrioformis]